MGRRWVQLFEEGNASERERLGGKGANLAEMTNLGLPVPPGFTVTTAACRSYLETEGRVPDGLWGEMDSGLCHIEERLGRRFGDPANPLLLSVRSGAKFSMPGMMDTVLNLGLNDETVKGLAAMANERFAYDAYRRLVQMYGKVVLGIEGDGFEKALTRARGEAAVESDAELSAEQLRSLVNQFKAIIDEQGKTMPDDPKEQLRQAVLAVFDSWNSPRAIAYRRSNRIPEDLGTAVNIQAMVFGNLGNDSASGVAFTRDPNTGGLDLFGEFLPNAQGEDVVAGIRTPRLVSEMESDPGFHDAYVQLLDIAGRLETHYRDMQDIEFTVEQGTLWMLQTRTGKRTAQAAVRIAVDMVQEGLIDRATAVQRIEPAHLEQLLHPSIDETSELIVIAKGLAASPGAATGIAIFDPFDARKRAAAGEDVILVRSETAAEDFPGMEKSRGILTSRGGMTSHAAVVARGMGTPAVTGCSAIEVDEEARFFRCNGQVIHEGEELTIDGSTGRVILGRVAMREGGLTEGVEELLRWADELKRLGVRANADTPKDAEQARTFGANGIGLCRTEHMFFAPERIDVMRAMILARTAADRAAALAKLEPHQAADFEGIFKAMAGLPVTIRLLDPPLHEFLPHTVEDQQRLANDLDVPLEQIEAAIEAHREANPMLGMRGCRLGILYPEITKMQARAIFTAAIKCSAAGVQVYPEIMVPLVADPDELRRQREVVDQTAHEVFAQAGRHVRYKVGTMIEVPRAALLASDVARHADFFSFGTNDLTQMTFGLSRDDADRFLPTYVEEGILADDPFQVLDEQGVGQLIDIATIRGKATQPGLSSGICGEHGGDPASVHYCHRIGLDYVSCSPFRVPIARLAAAHAALGIERPADR
jgi:pyruvate, orthophosphate dikinase